LTISQAARNHFNDRINWELHLGASQAMYPGAVAALPDYRNSSTGSYQFFSAGLKYNLTNPKMVKPNDVLAEIKRLRNLLAVRKFDFSDELAAECDRMELETKDYLSHYWFKRFSIGVEFPYSTRGFYYNKTDQNYQSDKNGYNPNSENTTSSYGNGYTPGFDFSNPFFCLGTDLGDYLTLEVGYSAKNHFMAGISLDISTPLFSLGMDFFNYIRTFSGAPNASSYPAGVH
jgi:hypothetical protein